MKNIASNDYIGLQIQALTENIEGNPPAAIASKMLMTRAQEYLKIGKLGESIVDFLRSYDLRPDKDAMKGILGIYVREMQESSGWLDLCKGEIWKDMSASSQKEDEMKKYIKEKQVKFVEHFVLKRYLSKHSAFERSETEQEVKDTLLRESNFELHEINNDQLIWGVLNPENQLINGYGIEIRTKKKTLSRKLIYNVFFVGKFSDELREGEGREYDLNTNQLQYHGYYKNSYLEGKGREFSKEGNIVYEGMYTQGRKHGRGDSYDEKKKTTVSGKWENGNLILDLNTDKLEPFRVDFHRIEMHLDHEKLIGRGSNGDEVYKLSSNLFPELGMPENTHVAVKIFNTRDVTNAAEKRMMYLELEKFFQLVMKLKKNQTEAEYIVDYKGIVKGKEIGYIIEFLDYSVASLIKKNVVFGINEVMRILRDTATCLDYIHSQYIIHKNLSWGNVFLSSDGRVKIGGFDESIEDTRRWNWKAENNVSSDNKSLLSGDLIFTAPEIYMGVKSIGVEADVFSFGLMMYSLMMSVVNPFSNTKECTKCGGKIEMKSLGEWISSSESESESKSVSSESDNNNNNNNNMSKIEEESEGEDGVVRNRTDSLQLREDIQRKRTKKNAPPPLLLLAKHLKVCGLEPATDESVINEEKRKKYEKYGELDFLIRLMKLCWDSKTPEKRPKMKSIVKRFDAEKTKKQCYNFIQLDMNFADLKRKKGWILLTTPTVVELREKILECSTEGPEFSIKEIKMTKTKEKVETDNDIVKNLHRGGQGGLLNSVAISVEYKKGMAGNMGGGVVPIMGLGGDQKISSVVMELQRVKEQNNQMLKDCEEKNDKHVQLEGEAQEKDKMIQTLKEKVTMLEKEVMSLQEQLLEETF